MRILLVMPASFERGRLGLENVVWLSEPVALTAVGSAVGPGHEVRVLDMRLEPEDALVREITAFRPDVVGTTSMTTDAYQAKAVLRTARHLAPAALTVVGGHHPTLSPDEFDEDYVDVIVQGEGELTFRELVDRWDAQRARGDRTFAGVAGTRYRDAVTGARRANAKRAQTASLDALPPPDRRLIAKYQGQYFFMMCKPMASIFTSRGCSYDCNFCAIWEFYERRVRYLSAKCIVDQMEACAEPFVFLLDDNFLVNKRRIAELCDEIERRGVKKLWMTQGRTDFVAQNPELMARLVRCGLTGLLSGFESNDDDTLASLRKSSSWEQNKRANAIMKELGIFATGIFMCRADWTAEQFDQLYEYIASLDIFLPLVTILTPLPGTQLYRAYHDKLLTTDHRLFDLLHAVLPTRLPREEFYRHFARSIDTLAPVVGRTLRHLLPKRPDATRAVLKNIPWFYARTWRYQRIHGDPRTFLRDEQGLLNGPGARAGLTWESVSYPRGDDRDHDAAHEPAASTGRLVPLRIPRKIWADELPAATTTTTTTTLQQAEGA